MNSNDKSIIKDYFFANQNLTVKFLAFTLIATQVGGGMIVGVCDAAYHNGLWGYLYPLSQIIGFILTFLFLCQKFKQLNVGTAAEIFTKVYRSPSMRKIASLLSCISLFVILIGQGIAIKKLMLSVGLTHPAGSMTIWGIVILYTSFGGFNWVVKTDYIQMIFLVFSLSILGYLGFNSLQEPMQEISHTKFLAMQQMLTLTLNSSYSKWQIISMLVWPALYIIIGQDMVQRFNAAQNAVVLKKAIGVSIFGIFSIASMPVLIGIAAKGNNLAATESISTLMLFATQFGYGLIIAAFVAILMAILSTTDSLLCAISSMVSVDFLADSQSNSLNFNRLLTCLIGIFAYLGTYLSNSILDVFVFSYGMTASALFIPIVYGLYVTRADKCSAAWAMSIGLLSYLGIYSWQPDYSCFALIIAWLSYEIIFLIKSPKC